MDGSRYTRAELTERVDFSEDLAVFRFEPEESLDFVPGQYATIGMEDGDRKILRPYSVVSAPHERELEFFLELVPDGALTSLCGTSSPNAPPAVPPSSGASPSASSMASSTIESIMGTFTRWGFFNCSPPGPTVV
jgi:hypothetical protein